MHLLYVDESGSVADPSQKYFVLAGVSIFERKTHWVEQSLNDVAQQCSPAGIHDVELHGSPMRTIFELKGFPADTVGRFGGLCAFQVLRKWRQPFQGCHRPLF